MVFPFITFTGVKGGRSRLSDFEFLSIKEFGGKLIHEISAEFSTNADQISYTVPNGKTFYHLKSKLYPVTDTIATGSGGASSSYPKTLNRRADVELTFDGTIKDVLTHDMETTHGSNASNANVAEGNSGQAGQYETNLVESMAGNGTKQIKLTSTNTSGTYRVTLMGIIETTGTSPKIT